MNDLFLFSYDLFLTLLYVNRKNVVELHKGYGLLNLSQHTSTQNYCIIAHCLCRFTQ